MTTPAEDADGMAENLDQWDSLVAGLKPEQLEAVLLFARQARQVYLAYLHAGWDPRHAFSLMLTTESMWRKP